jgi:hypothetical protein
MVRWIHALLWLATAVLICWALALWLRAPSGAEAFVVEGLERDLGPTPVGTIVVTFRITNRSNEMRRILGLDDV